MTKLTGEYNIIGDTAGRYDTLQALLAQMPAATPVSVGDMVDRGPKSKQVLEFFMKNGLAVMGNHEHMMLDFLTRQYVGKIGFYERGLWPAYNGGMATVNSFLDPNGNIEIYHYDGPIKMSIDPKLVEWMSKLPLYLMLEGAVITHAPLRGDFTFKQIIDIGVGAGFNRNYVNEWIENNPGKYKSSDDSMIWNRGKPRRKDDVGLQIYGHNSYKDVNWHTDENGKFAVCIDSCKGQKMTGIHWPSGEIFQQDFIEVEDDL